MSWDPYAALGLGRTATADEIRRAYRKPRQGTASRRAPGRQSRRGALQARHGGVQPAFRSGVQRRASTAARSMRTAMSAWRSVRARCTAGRARGQRGAGPGGPAGADAFDLGDIFSDLFGSGFGRRARLFAHARARHSLHARYRFPRRRERRQAPCFAWPKAARSTSTFRPGVESGQVLRLKGQGGAGVQGGPAGDALVELNGAPARVLPPRRPGHSHGLEHLADRGGRGRARAGADAERASRR